MSNLFAALVEGYNALDRVQRPVYWNPPIVVYDVFDEDEYEFANDPHSCGPDQDEGDQDE